ncbi:MAG: hypothetical protein OXI43_08105 [Candidatus Poribacteria bacterium]|nr:hypothetical protein [Candidatus Poribacteria bacterium]
MKNRKYQHFFGFGIAFLLIFASFAIADTTEETAEAVEAAEPKKSPIKIGGAMRANYVYGTYTDGRGDGIGDVDLEILRINADLDFNNIIGRLEYRWYPRWFGSSSGYSMIHTAWLGYNLEDLGSLKAGIVRVPFGPGPYGVSSSWFFDQHFYVGLSDDPDLGVRWTGSFDKLTYDVAYYLQSEFQTDGDYSLNSSRYAYDVVTRRIGEDGDDEEGYDEQHQFNVRAIYAVENIADVGVSFQYGLLKATNVGDDENGSHYAFSAHMKNSYANFTLFSQFSYYDHIIADETPWGNGDTILMGAYDYASPVASNGMIPAVSLRYNGINTSGISWLDSVTPYVEWSSIIKTAEDYNPSTLIAIGASWTLFGSLYVYSDFAVSDGNPFVGNDGAGDLAANEDYDDKKQNYRLNLNFGYYF